MEEILDFIDPLELIMIIGVTYIDLHFASGFQKYMIHVIFGAKSRNSLIMMVGVISIEMEFASGFQKCIIHGVFGAK